MAREKPVYITFDGLDATGKTTLAGILGEESGTEVVSTPPKWMKPYREQFNDQDIRIRFLFYAFGNLAADRQVVRPALSDSRTLVVQDRSWLSTLSAHEVRGVSSAWLALGRLMANMCEKPDLGLIIVVDPEERRKRLNERGLFNKTDMQNLSLEDRLNHGYDTWAKKLGWNTIHFDNTQISINQSIEDIKNIIQKLRV